MKPRIDMIGIITSRFQEMRDFYANTLNFPIALEMPNFVEFQNEGVRFSISTNEVMHQATGHKSYTKPHKGSPLELAFRTETPAEVDSEYKKLTSAGATPIKGPHDLPWNQRAAFFADPDGNIHEIFADLPDAN